jgi:hypothetical protein
VFGENFFQILFFCVTLSVSVEVLFVIPEFTSWPNLRFNGVLSTSLLMERVGLLECPAGCFVPICLIFSFFLFFSFLLQEFGLMSSIFGSSISIVVSFAVISV